MLDEYLARVIPGDCLPTLRGMDSDSVDAVITDPPYGTNTASWDSDPTAGVWHECIRISRGFVAVFGYPECHLRWAEFFKPLVPIRSVAWWHYNHPCRAGSMMREWQQIVIWGERGAKIAGGERIRQPYADNPSTAKFARGGKGRHPDGRVCGDVWRIPTPGASFNSHLRNHPNEKPIEAMRRLVLLLAEAGGTVLDPFCGSGTTGVAAVQAGRRFIGCEMEPEYVAIAEARIAHAHAARTPQLDLSAA